MAWPTKDIPNLSSRTTVVAGANGGLGLRAARTLARAAESRGGFTQKFFHSLAGSTGMTAANDALLQLRAATDPGARGGAFYIPRFTNTGVPVRRPIFRRLGLSSAIRTLWAVSKRETGIPLDVRSALPT